MRFLLLFVLCVGVIDLNAQSCGRNALMQKGAQLEYMVYNPGFRKGNAARLIYEVASVDDSAGSTFSTIIKKGFGIRDEKKDHYEKTIRLQCDGKNLLIPFDFYGADTTWFNDGNTMSIIKRHLFFTGNAPLEDPNANYRIPLELEGVSSLPTEPKKVKQKVTRTGVDPDYQIGNTWYHEEGWKKLKGETGIWVMNYEVLYTIDDIWVGDKQKVTTAAGTYECYNIVVDCSFEFNGERLVNKCSMRYNPEVGLVKMEMQLFNDKKKFGKPISVELLSVKK